MLTLENIKKYHDLRKNIIGRIDDYFMILPGDIVKTGIALHNVPQTMFSTPNGSVEISGITFVISLNIKTKKYDVTVKIDPSKNLEKLRMTFEGDGLEFTEVESSFNIDELFRLLDEYINYIRTKYENGE